MALTKIDDRGLKTPIDLLDDEKIRLGTGNDLDLYHTSGVNYLQTHGNSNLEIKHGSDVGIKSIADGSAELYYDGNKKFHTHSTGVTVTGYLHIEDGSTGIGLGNSDDLKLYHDGSNSYVDDTGTGQLQILSNNVVIKTPGGSESMIRALENGAVELYYDNSKKFETLSTGAKITGRLYTTGYIYIDNGEDLWIEDNGKIQIGNGADLQIYHDSSNGNSYIKEVTANQPLRICSSDLQFRNADDSHLMARIISDAQVELYYDNNLKLATNNDGITLDNNAAQSTIYLKANGATKGYIFAGSGNEIGFKTAANEWGVQVDDNSEVALYYDGGKKFETHSIGTHTHGQMKASSDGNWANSGGGAYHEVNGSGASGYEFRVRNNQASPASQYIQEIKFSAAAPDDTNAQFLDCRDSSGARYRIYSNGDTWSSDGGSVNSDRTLKENIVDATPKLEDLKKLKVRNFNFKSEVHPNSNNKRLGFIAQEVEEVFPSLVNEYRFNAKEEETPVMKKAIKDAWAPILVKALQEAIVKIETLETEVAALKAK